MADMAYNYTYTDPSGRSGTAVKSWPAPRCLSTHDVSGATYTSAEVGSFLATALTPSLAQGSPLPPPLVPCTKLATLILPATPTTFTTTIRAKPPTTTSAQATIRPTACTRHPVASRQYPGVVGHRPGQREHLVRQHWHRDQARLRHLWWRWHGCADSIDDLHRLRLLLHVPERDGTMTAWSWTTARTATRWANR